MDRDTRRRLGLLMARAIELSGRSQESVAEAADIAPRTIRNMAKGEHAPQEDVLLRLGTVLFDELNRQLTDIMNQRVQWGSQAHQLESGYQEAVIRAKALSEARRAAESGTLEALASEAQESLAYFAEAVGEVPGLKKQSAVAKVEQNDLMRFLAYVSQNVRRDDYELAADEDGAIEVEQEGHHST